VNFFASVLESVAKGTVDADERKVRFNCLNLSTHPLLLLNRSSFLFAIYIHDFVFQPFMISNIKKEQFFGCISQLEFFNAKSIVMVMGFEFLIEKF
jgi:hypothetical protein